MEQATALVLEESFQGEIIRPDGDDYDTLGQVFNGMVRPASRRHRPLRGGPPTSSRWSTSPTSDDRPRLRLRRGARRDTAIGGCR